MSSGVGVCDAVKDTFKDMKVQKNEDEKSKRLRIVTLVITDSVIQLGKIYRQGDLDKVDDVYKFFVEVVKSTCACYVLYDCHFDTKESYKEELVFGMWIPEDTSIKLKMLYSSSKQAIKKVCTGVKHDVQMNDPEDLEDKHWFAEKLGKKMIKLEGVDMPPPQQQKTK